MRQLINKINLQILDGPVDALIYKGFVVLLETLHNGFDSTQSVLRSVDRNTFTLLGELTSSSIDLCKTKLA